VVLQLCFPHLHTDWEGALWGRAGVPGTRLGVRPDINCPVSVRPPGGDFLHLPGPSRTKQGTATPRSCATFCNGKGLFYSWEICR